MTEERFPFVGGAIQRGRALLLEAREQDRRARELRTWAKTLWAVTLILSVWTLLLFVESDRRLQEQQRLTVSSPEGR